MSSNVMRIVAAAVLCVAVCVPLFAQEPASTLPVSVPDAIVLLRIKNINHAAQTLIDTAASFNPMFAPTVQQGIDEMKRELAGVNLDAPAALLILGADKEPLGIFTLSDPQAFEQNEQATAALKALGNLGFICDDAETVDSAIAAFKEKGITAIPTADMKDMLVMDANMSELMAKFKPEITAGIETARMAIAGADGAGADALTETQGMTLRALNHLEKLVDEIERQGGPMQMGLSFNPHEAAVNLDMSVTPGSAAAQLFSENSMPVNLTLAKYLPQDVYWSTIQSFAPESQARVMNWLVDMAADVFMLDAAEADAMHKAVATQAAALTGLNGSAEIADANGAKTSIMIFGITSRDAARESVKGFIELTKNGKLGKLAEEYGFTVNFFERHRDSDGIPVDKIEISIDFNKIADAFAVPAEQREFFIRAMSDAIRKTYGTDNTIVMEIAYGKKLATLVHGADVETHMDKQVALLKSGSGGLLDMAEYKQAIANQQEKASALMHFSLFRFNDVLAGMLADQGMMMGPMQMLPTRAELPPVDQPMSMGVVFSENKMSMKFHVPMQPIRDYVNIVQRKMMQMMQQMMPPGGMPPMPADELDDF